MDEVEGQGHQIVGSVVEIVAQVDGVDDAALQAAVERGGRGLSVLRAAQARRRDGRRLRPTRRDVSNELAAARRTHKAFGPEPVPRETLLEILAVARFAPTHHMTEPWRFRVLGPDTLAALKEVGRREGGREARPRADARRRDGRAHRRPRPGRGGRLRDGGRDRARAPGRDRARHRDVLAHAAGAPHASPAATRSGSRPASASSGSSTSARAAREPAPREREPVERYVEFLP